MGPANHQKKCDALIVGAGIGGLAAGLALRRAGWNVRIFERAANPRELGFALLLAPNAIAALRRLDLADVVIRGGARMTGAELRQPDGLVLRVFDATKFLDICPSRPSWYCVVFCMAHSSMPSVATLWFWKVRRQASNDGMERSN